MYESARALMTWNPAFQDVFLYYRNRTKKPLGGMQAKIAVACKAIRIFYVVLKTGCDFDEEKVPKGHHQTRSSIKKAHAVTDNVRQGFNWCWITGVLSRQ